MKLLGDAVVEKVRREEHRTRPELKGSRYVWTKNPENLTPTQFGLWSALDVPSLNLKTCRAYHIRLNFQEIWALPVEDTDAFFKQWYFWATHSRLEPIVKAARTIKGYPRKIARSQSEDAAEELPRFFACFDRGFRSLGERRQTKQ
jgi:transposase